jgi:hypothetical protein
VGSISPAADGSIHWELPPASLDWLLPHGQGPVATGQGPDLVKGKAKASPCTGLESGQLPGCKLVQSPVFCLPGHVAVQGLCRWWVPPCRVPLLLLLTLTLLPTSHPLLLALKAYACTRLHGVLATQRCV